MVTGSVVDYTDRYSNDSEALDKWIADCFMDPQPSTSYYCEPISVAAPARDNQVIPLVNVIKEDKLKSRVYGKRVTQFDPVSALEETQRFVAKLLGTENSKKINVSHSGVGYGVRKQELVSRSLNPKQQQQRDKTSSGYEKLFHNSRLMASKRKFDDSDGEGFKDVKKQRTIPGIVRKRPEQPKCVEKPIGKPSLRKQFLATGTYTKFQPLVC